MPSPENKPRKPRLPERLREFARNMRAEPTDAEARLWRLIRRQQLDGFRFRRQHPIAGYIADFYCHEARLAIELDGGQHVADPVQAAHDEKRDQAIVDTGVRILRFWDIHVLKNTDGVLEEIWDALHARGEPESVRSE